MINTAHVAANTCWKGVFHVMGVAKSQSPMVTVLNVVTNWKEQKTVLPVEVRVKQKDLAAYGASKS